MRARSRPGASALTLAALLVGTSALALPSARAELPAPEPLPPGVIAPVQSADGDGLVAPVYAPGADELALVAPMYSPDGDGEPLIAPIHGADGAWNQMRADEGEQFTLSGEVHFEKHEAVLSQTAIDILDDLAESWQDDPPQRVTIVGHTDSDGEEAYNQDLSERRAQAVADHLSEQVPQADFEVFGKGESEPLRDESEGDEAQQAEAKDQNRRVVITVPD